MSTVVPNRVNDALSSLSAQMIQLMLENRRFGLEERRLSATESAMELDRQNSALQRLVTISPFLPHGKTLAEMPEIHDTVREAFPDFDPTDTTSMGGLVFNPETIEHVLQPMVIASLSSMPDAQKQQWTERALNRIGLGTPSSSTELAAQQSQAQTYLDAMHDLRQDPRALEGIYRRSVGLEVPTRVMYQGREIKFDTATAASITAQLWQHTDEMSMRTREMSRTTQLDLAGELMGQMTKNNITLGRASATSIVSAYSQREQLRVEGRLTEQNDPVRSLYNASAPEVRTAIEAFQGAVSFGENTYRTWLAQSPEGQQVVRFMDLSGALHGAGVPSESIPGLLDQITGNRQIGGTAGLPVYSQPGFWGTGNTINFRTPLPAPSGAPPVTQPGAPGGPSHQDLRRMMEDDAAALAEGRISIATINQKYTNPAQRNAVVLKSRVLRSQR